MNDLCKARLEKALDDLRVTGLCEGSIVATIGWGCWHF